MFSIQDFKADGEKLVQVVLNDMATVKTGRAKPSLVENVEVEVYGTTMKVMELATISSPDTSMLVIAPWDSSVLSAINKGILAAGLNLNPVVDSNQIRISIPPLTEERRLEMVKLVKQKLESGKQMVGDLRSKFKKMIDDQKGKPGISEDDIERDLEAMQKEVEALSTKLEDLSKKKETELMEI